MGWDRDGMGWDGMGWDSANARNKYLAESQNGIFRK